MTSTKQREAKSDLMKRLKTTLDTSVLFLFPLCILAFAIHKIVASDFWWQLKTGEWVLEHGFPHTDPFSYAWPDRPWIEMRWLYCVTIHSIFKHFGLNFVILAKAGLLLLLFGLLWRLNAQGKKWAVNLGLVCTLALAQHRFMIRPELATFLLLTATLFVSTDIKMEAERAGSIRFP